MFGNPRMRTQMPRGSTQDDQSRSSSMSRPSAKSIYMQRKEYSESITKQPDHFQQRVEHLITCDLDGQPAKNVDDCLGQLKQLDTKGKVWAQDMLLDIQNSCLRLCDIETKEELDSLPLGAILGTLAVLDSCEYNSILAVTVQDSPRRPPQVFMFQCTETGAQEMKSDLDKAIQHRDSYIPEPPQMREPPSDIRSNLENIIGRRYPGPPMQPERTPSPPNHPPPRWGNAPDYDDQPMLPPVHDFDSQPPWQEPPPQFDPLPPPNETERNVEIFNHVLNDTEFFMGKVGACVEGQRDSKKGKKKKNKGMQSGGMLPAVEEYFSFLQKIKYGFNLLGKLNGEINNPTAPEFVHSLFSMLTFVVPCYPADIPPQVLTPFLTEQAFMLLGQTVTQQEDQLWRTLGDSWNVTRQNWPDGDFIPPYIPVFYDGWEPPPPAVQHRHSDRVDSQRPSQYSTGNDLPFPPEQDQMGWNPPPQRFSEPLLQMRVIYPFMARNSQEISLMKEEVVEVIDKSKQWWKVRNRSGEEGYVPPNVLESMEEQQMRDPPSLSMSSRPADVKAWLEYKGFSKLTVKTLGVLTGELLLKMTRDEIRMVCPEDGGRVFFQLQAVKSSLALADESNYNYNGY